MRQTQIISVLCFNMKQPSEEDVMLGYRCKMPFENPEERMFYKRLNVKKKEKERNLPGI